MKTVSFVKMGVAAAVVVFGSSTAVQASNANLVPNGTYVFNSTDGNTAIDGSTVTFLNDAITSWDLLDATISPGVNLPPLTPGNSSIISDFVFGQTQYGPNGWFFTIGSPVGVSSTTASTFWFESQNELFGPGVGGGLASIYDGFGNGPSADPDGSWVLETTRGGSAAVPDSSSTMQLFAGALTVLAAGKSFLGRRR